MHRILVFAASALGNKPAHLEAAKSLGAEIGKRGFGLVYGGADRGLMGACADAALAAGAEVIGVLPRALATREIAHRGLTQLRIVKSMSERKLVMGALADAVVALPGGIGTLDELFEVLCERALKTHDKKVGLLDAAGYWQPMLRFLEQARDDGLIGPRGLDQFEVRDNAAALLDAIEP
jgi:uncharacterized protein (TIGR00730 family)